MRNRRAATRPRGRPRLADGVATKELALALTAPDYEAMRAIAAAERTNVQAVIRSVLARFLHERQRTTTTISTTTTLSPPRAARSVVRRGVL